MAKKPTLTDISSGYQATNVLNENFELLRDAFDNTVSRDGSVPNQMAADLDMDSNDILNTKDMDISGILTVQGTDINDLITGVGPGTIFNTVNRYSGDGTTVAFTLSRAPIARANTHVTINGIYQQKNTYNISGTTLTFSEAPPLGSANVEVVVQESVDSITVSETTGYTTRALFVSDVAAGTVWTDGEVVTAAGLSYVKSTGATDISDLNDWVPFGLVYVDHFAENVSPATTDMTTAIQTAGDYSASNLIPVHLNAGVTYRTSSTLRFKSSFTRLHCIGSVHATIRYYGSDTEPAIWVGPDDPDLTATSMITSFGMENIVVLKNGSTSSDYGILARKVSGIKFRNVVTQGFWKNYRMEGCWNVFYDETVGFAASFDGSTPGGAIFSIDSFAISDGAVGERFNGLTHIFTGRNVSSKNNSGSLVYDAQLEIQDNDNLRLSNVYWGFAGTHILIKPSTAEAKIWNLQVSNSYFDTFQGGTGPVTLKVDFDGLTLTGGMGNVIFDNCIMNVQSHILEVVAGASPQGLISFNNCDMHACTGSPFLIGSTAVTALRVQIDGGYINVGSGLVDPAIDVAKATSFAVNGVAFTGTSAVPWCDISNTVNVVLRDNEVGGSFTGAVLTSITNSEIGGGINDGVSSGTFTPAVAFGGASVGLTYTGTPWLIWRRDGNRVEFSGYFALATKGTSTGEATVTLPFASMTNRSVPFSVMGQPGALAGAAYLSGFTSSGAASFVVRRVNDGGTLTTLDDTHYSNTSWFSFSGSYFVDPF